MFYYLSFESSISTRYFISSTLATSTPLSVMVIVRGIYAKYMVRRAGSDLFVVKGMIAVLDGLMLSPS